MATIVQTRSAANDYAGVNQAKREESICKSALNRRLVRTGLAAVCALAVAGCYVVPLQSDAGQPPVYAYTTHMPPPAIYNRASPVPGPVLPASLHVRLYPMNETATQQGALQGVVADTQGGRGTFTLAVAGDQLQGEATRVPDNYPGFGRVFRDVLGESPATAPGSRKGVANASGSRGMFANCEYVMTTPAMGTGVCAFSNGAKYQLHFGG